MEEGAAGLAIEEVIFRVIHRSGGCKRFGRKRCSLNLRRVSLCCGDGLKLLP